MTSGIYKLTFSNGDTYIGKSVNINTRWDQHRDKLIKGAGAKAMQRAYNECGFPMGEIIFECHSDHIDLAEACLISRIKPTLNATRPADPFSHISDDDLMPLLRSLEQSTLEHLSRISNLLHGKEEALSLIDTLERENTNLQRTISNLEKRRSAEDIAFDVNKKLANKDTLIRELTLSVNALEKREKFLLNKLAELSKPWWQRLFN